RGSPRKRAFGKSDPVTEKENSQIPLSWDSEETLHTFASSSIFDRIDEEQGVTKRSRSSFYGDGIPDIYPTDFSAFTNLSSSSPKSALSKLEDMEKTKSATLPHDLRLGWKLRMESKKPFPWMNNPLVPGELF
ncbi:unnamed protein product, partial [Toxocara canis]|uniref:Spen homolog, transcriptional regulator n=1 Tax=Toxocara canis TaxID=6265 RepID=A0A183U7G7_TOXCA